MEMETNIPETTPRILQEAVTVIAPTKGPTLCLCHDPEYKYLPLP